MSAQAFPNLQVVAKINGKVFCCATLIKETLQPANIANVVKLLLPEWTRARNEWSNQRNVDKLEPISCFQWLVTSWFQFYLGLLKKTRQQKQENGGINVVGLEFQLISQSGWKLRCILLWCLHLITLASDCTCFTHSAKVVLTVEAIMYTSQISWHPLQVFQPRGCPTQG